MHWIAGFFDTLILLGALQGFIVSGLLYHRNWPSSSSGNFLSRRLLASLIFLLALACLDIFLMKQPWTTSTTAGAVLSAIIPMIIIMPVGPLIFFYVKSCLEPEFQMGRRERRHFYTVIIDLFPQALAILYILALLTGIIPNNKYHLGDVIDTYDVYSDIPRWVSLVIYLWLSVRYLAADRKNASAIRDTRTPGINTSSPLDWPRQLVRLFLIFAVIWLLFLVPYVIPRSGNWLIDTLDWYPIYLPLVFMIYWLGVKGYFISYQTGPGKKPVPARPRLQEEAIGHAIQSLKKCMEEDRLWLNPELNLPMLAQHSNLASKTLSTVLNQHMNKTFNEFVNEYRVLEVRKRLLMPESRTLTIAGLAYECGFNSLPTFQRAFKTMTGLSPKEFLLKNAGPAQKTEND